MEVEKLILLSKKLNKILKTKPPRDIFNKIYNDSLYEPLKQMLTGEEIIILTFLTNGLNRTQEVNRLYEQIVSNLFVFSIIHVEDVDPYENCSSCGSDGLEYCSECNRRGEVDCEDCDGTGEYEDGEICDSCRGDGIVKCRDCGGDGDKTCQECDGTGEVSIDNQITITQNYYVSYDPNIYSALEIMEKESEIGSEFDTKIYRSSRTLILSSITGEAEIDDNRFSNGDRIFGDLEKDYLDFYKETWGLLNGNLKDYII